MIYRFLVLIFSLLGLSTLVNYFSYSSRLNIEKVEIIDPHSISDVNKLIESELEKPLDPKKFIASGNIW